MNNLTQKQKDVVQDLMKGLTIPMDVDTLRVQVENQGCIPIADSPIDFENCGVAVGAALGATINYMGTMRNLPDQSFSVDKHKMGLIFTSSFYLFRNGWQQSFADERNVLTAPYKTKDGRYFMFQGGYRRLLLTSLNLLDCAPNAKAIAERTLNHTMEEWEDIINSKGLCGIGIRTKEEWAAHPQGKILSSKPVIEVEKIGDGKPVPLSSNPKDNVLNGINVVDLTRVLAGPTLSRTLAGCGANVLHLRKYYLDWLHTYSYEASFGKWNTTLDYTIPDNKDRLLELLKKADVVVDGYGPQALSRYGIGVEDVLKINPNIVYAQLSAFGLSGPWGTYKGWDQLAQATTGMMLLDDPDKIKIFPGYFNDYSTGIIGAIGVMDALVRRAKEGGAYRVEVALSKTGMLSTRHALSKDRDRTYQPLTVNDLRNYLVDFDSPIGCVSSVDGIVSMEKTPMRFAFQPTLLGTNSIPESWDQIEQSRQVIHAKKTRYNRFYFDSGNRGAKKIPELNKYPNAILPFLAQE